MTQADCSSRDSRLSLLTAQCLLPHNTHAVMLYGGDVDGGCMRLQVTQEFCPPCTGSAKVLTFFFCFLSAILIPKKKRK